MVQASKGTHKQEIPWLYWKNAARQIYNKIVQLRELWTLRTPAGTKAKEDPWCVSVKTKHESGDGVFILGWNIKGKSALRFMSNATTNGVCATQTADLFHRKPSLNPVVGKRIDIHTCNHIKNCVCSEWTIRICCSAPIHAVCLKNHSCLILLLDNFPSLLFQFLLSSLKSTSSPAFLSFLSRFHVLLPPF